MICRRAYVPGLLVLLLSSLLSSAAFGQGLIAFSGGGGGTPDGRYQGTATFRPPMPSPRVLTNAPYSGQQVHTTVQTLADGTHITSPPMATMGPVPKTWRDSQGRVRMERSMLLGNNNLRNVPTLVQIDDPVSGYAYVMDDVNRVAHRIALTPSSQRSTAMARRANPAPTAAGRGRGGAVATGTLMSGAPAQIQANRPATMSYDMMPPQPTTESLGTQMIDGVLAQGTRMTRIIPTGAQGNDGPITITTDNWYSPDLQLNLLTVTTDPRSGVQTTKFTDFSRAEPDPALFMVPVGYSIVDETGAFTIKWGEN
jgi:hypothetical protein